jgi:hypothetical protein
VSHKITRLGPSRVRRTNTVSATILGTGSGTAEGSGGNVLHDDGTWQRQTWKEAVRVATTGNVTIATALNAGDTIDGVTLAAGDRVLVRAQTAGEENGIYTVAASPTRVTDFDDGTEVLGTVVAVTAGSTLAGKLYRTTNTTEPTIDTDAITFADYGAATSDHIADTSDAHDASAISIADSGDFFTATEVEAALAELGAAIFNPGIVRSSDVVGDPAGVSMSNANQAVFVRWMGTGSISKIGVQVIVSSGNVCAAVYAPTDGTGLNSGLGRDAKPGARKATTGSTACPASGYAELSLGGSVTIEPGDWLGFSADNTTATFIMIDDGGAGLVTNLFKGLRYYRGVFTLPDPASPEAAAMLRAPFAIGVP